MQPPIPPEIRVESLFEGVRYRLPRRTNLMLRLVHLFLGVIGLILIAFPFVPYFTSALDQQSNFPKEGLLFFVLCPGIITIPLGVWMICYSLLLVFGGVELFLTKTHLVCTARLGWLMGWTRLRLADIRGFRVETGKAATGSSESHLEGFSTEEVGNLKADRDQGRWSWVVYAYPKDWLLAISANITARLEARGIEMPVEVENLDATIGEDRVKQPTESDAVFREIDGGCVIETPPKGIWRGANTGLLFFAVFWNLLLTLISLLGGWAVLQDVVAKPRELLMFLLVVTPFWAVGIGLILTALHQGRKRWRISVRREQLTIERIGLFGTKVTSYQRDQLRQVFAHYEEANVLVVEQGNEQRDTFLNDRPKAELAWIATTIRRYLNLAAQPSANQPEAETPETEEQKQTRQKLRRRMLVVNVLVFVLLVLFGWESRNGYDQTGRSTSLYWGPIAFFAQAPQAKDLPEANHYAGVRVTRWYLVGMWRTQSSAGKVP